ncbi:MAG: hypothetical protein ACJ762_18670 [Solirubrobacteraceae bacterium]
MSIFTNPDTPDAMKVQALIKRRDDLEAKAEALRADHHRLHGEARTLDAELQAARVRAQQRAEVGFPEEANDIPGLERKLAKARKQIDVLGNVEVQLTVIGNLKRETSHELHAHAEENFLALYDALQRELTPLRDTYRTKVAELRDLAGQISQHDQRLHALVGLIDGLNTHDLRTDAETDKAITMVRDLPTDITGTELFPRIWRLNEMVDAPPAARAVKAAVERGEIDGLGGGKTRWPQDDIAA